MSYARAATVNDAIVLAPILRLEDVAEVKALSDQEPLEALLRGIRDGTETFTIVDDHEDVVGMFGIGSHPGYGDGMGAVWLLASPGLVHMQCEFMRQTRPFLSRFHQRYPLLWNVVDARNTVHIRWLRYFGFSAIKLHEHLGVEQRPFYEFVRIDPTCATQLS